MSSNLTWEPIERKKQTLSTELKFALRKRYGEPVNCMMNTECIPYLNGLLDAGVADAQKLIDALHKHKEISISEEY